MLETDSSPSPVESATPQSDLQRLAQYLQRQLRSLPLAEPLQIQCVVKQGNLMILGQHPLTEEPQAPAVFGALQQALQTLPPALLNGLAPETVKALTHVKLYLRALGQRQPYAYHLCELASPVTSVPEVPSTVSTEAAAPLAEPIAALDMDAAALNPERDEYASIEQDDPANNSDLPLTKPSDLIPLELEEPPVVLSKPVRSPLLPWLVAGVGISIIAFGSGLWFMSRPCMAGACEPLQSAQALSQQSTQTIQAAKTGQALQQARQQLAEAERILQTVPTWSSHHNEAQALQQTYQSQVEALDRVLAAEGKATTATQKSQTLPLSTADLQTTQALWRDAIAQLQTIPQTDALYAFAQQRLTAYTANLAAISKLTSAEQQAQKQLAVAKETATIATTRQGIAQTPENWQLVQSTWQVAVNSLRQIPTSTTSYAESQQLLSDYRPKLAAARDRATQEQIAKRAFTQALALAQKADAAQRKNQWSQAVINWREALTNAKQVPSGTTYGEPAQPLVASYTTSLKQAEARLQFATAMQRTRADLNRVCAGSPKLCSFAIASDVIRVQFTPSYERALRTAFVVGRSGDYGTLGGAVNHIETLQTALQTIANNAGLPMEVYSADGSELIGSFNPGN